MSINKENPTTLVQQGLTLTNTVNEVTELIQDPVAYAIYCYLMGRPPGWTVRRSQIMDRFGIGRDKYQKSLKELKDLGLVYTVSVKDENGKFTSHNTVVSQLPVDDLAHLTTVLKNRTLENQHTGLPTSGKSGPLEKKELLEKKDTRKERTKRGFQPPTLADVEAYVREKALRVDPNHFVEFFEAGDWHDSRGNKVKNWKQKLLTWHKSGVNHGNRNQQEQTRKLTPAERVAAKARENGIPGFDDTVVATYGGDIRPPVDKPVW